MRLTGLVLGFCLLAAPAFAETISPCDADKYIGKLVTVEGVVASKPHHSAKATFINMCGVYPNAGFTGVIFLDDLTKFPGIDSLEGKTVDITGRIQPYQTGPEIKMNDPAQLTVK
jgi:DNA/RNA endonuclease YhcR with UshA esterase domain